MVGHTGDIPATVTAVETVDACVGRVLDAITRAGGTALVTADHGNAERMLDDEGRPHTAHTTFPVHLILVTPGGAADAGRGAIAAPDPTGARRQHPAPPALHDGILADVAPTVLELMGVPQPPEMTGRSLLS